MKKIQKRKIAFLVLLLAGAIIYGIWYVDNKLAENETIMIQLPYYEVHPFNHNLALVSNLDGKTGVINTDGTAIIPIEYPEKTITVDNNWIFIEQQSDNISVADNTGHIHFTLVIPLKYDEAEEFKNGMSLIKQDEKYYFINTRGKKTTSIEFDKILPFYEDDSWIMNRYEGFYDDQMHYGSLGGNAIARSGTTWYILKKQ